MRLNSNPALNTESRELRKVMITRSQFAASVSKTFASDSSFDYPRKPQDRVVFFGALSIALAKQESYSEVELNEAIVDWLRGFGSTTALDHVTLRRYLVDAGYLRRDEAGLRYSVEVAGLAAEFEESVLALDAHEIVRQARLGREARKQAYGVR